MAVVANAGPAERALDEIVALREGVDLKVNAAKIAALWSVVFAQAVRDADARLATVALGEHMHWHRIMRTAPP